jgi:hypothetical protein
MRKLLLLLGLLALAGLPALAHGPTSDIDFYFAVDGPTDLPLTGGSTTVLPWTLARHRNPAPRYTLSLAPASPLALPPPSVIDSCHLLTDRQALIGPAGQLGEWLFSVEEPMDDPSGVARTFRPGDLIRYDSLAGTYSKFFDGVGVGLADGVNVDAAFIRYQNTIDGNLYFQRDNGHLILSFDVPADLGGVTYMPSDLVEFRFVGPSPANWIVVGLYFDSQAAGIPEGWNVTGADERGGFGTGGGVGPDGPHKVIVSFDVPTDDPAGPLERFLLGDLVSADPVPLPPAVTPGPYHRDPLWAVPPASPYSSWGSRINALCFPASPGQIPCTPPTLKLHLGKGPGVSDITLTWSASCSVGAEDYGIHEGTIGSWYSHDEVDCHDNGGDLTEVYTYSPGDYYYLVVPWNPNDEGSYGQRSVPPLAPPMERPVSSPFPSCTAYAGPPGPVGNNTDQRELSCP